MSWLLSNAGGGVSESMAERTTVEVQTYFERFCPFFAWGYDPKYEGEPISNNLPTPFPIDRDGHD